MSPALHAGVAEAVAKAAEAAQAAATALHDMLGAQSGPSSGDAALLLAAASASTSAAAASASAAAALLTQLGLGAEQFAAAAPPAVGEERHCGRVAVIDDGAAELQAALDTLPLNSLAVVSWHADWCGPCTEAAAALEDLAPRYPGAAFFLLDVEASAANTALALEKVMLRPESRRPGAKPALKQGRTWPCLTLHYSPSLQAAQTFSGPEAVAQAEGALRGHGADVAPPPAAGEAEPAAVSEPVAAAESMAAATISSSAALRSGAGASGASPAAGRLVEMERGAGQLKEVLLEAKAAACPVVVVWTQGGSEGDAALWAAAQAAAASPGSPTLLLLVDASHTHKANRRLAEALGVKAFPELHLYRDMKLERKLVGAGQADVAGLRALLAELEGDVAAVPAATGAEAAGGSSDGAGDVASGQEQQGQPAAAEAEDVYAPPAGKFARKNAIKRMPDGVVAHFFPKMPCLRCGCPWWTSDEWDARCCRCRWDCETGGYDDESRPLPRYAKKYEAFVEAIAAGRTPAYTLPSASAR